MFRIPLRRFLPLALFALAMFALTASGFAQDGEAHKGTESQSVFDTIKEGGPLIMLIWICIVGTSITMVTPRRRGRKRRF